MTRTKTRQKMSFNKFSLHDQKLITYIIYQVHHNTRGILEEHLGKLTNSQYNKLFMDAVKWLNTHRDGRLFSMELNRSEALHVPLRI